MKGTSVCVSADKYLYRDFDRTHSPIASLLVGSYVEGQARALASPFYLLTLTPPSLPLTSKPPSQPPHSCGEQLNQTSFIENLNKSHINNITEILENRKKKPIRSPMTLTKPHLVSG